MPDWYLDQPEIPDDPIAFWVLSAYADLTTCRHPGGPIPWSAFRVYAEAKALSPDAADALWPVIAQMDSAERKWRADEAKRRQEGDDGG